MKSDRVREGSWVTEVTRHVGADREPLIDAVAVEEPLEIRFAGDVVAVTMRTPGHDRELALGFLLAEGIVPSADAVGGLAHCGRPGSRGNALEVAAAPGAIVDWDPEAPARRGTLVSSACGVCGRRSIDDLLRRVQPLDDVTRYPAAWVSGLTAALLDGQPGFSRNGGLHAAALWRADRKRVVVREDVGRHNAVDKVVGEAALAGELPLVGGALVVSGRASFELVQKAVVARVPLLVSVSAPSSLAVQTARRAGLSLVGFARGDRFNVYSGHGRIGRASAEPI